MATQMKRSDFDTWYRWLNVSRAGAGLGALASPGFNGAANSAELQTFINHIRSTMTDNAQLGLADYNINQNNFVKGHRLDEADRKTLEDTALSILRVCVNKTCETVCNNTGTNQYQTHSNVPHQNTVNQYDTNHEGIKTYELKSNVTRQNEYYSNQVKTNLTDQNGYNSYQTKSNGSFSYGVQYATTKSNGTKSYQTNSYNFSASTKSNGTKSNGKNSYSCGNGTLNSNAGTCSAKAQGCRQDANHIRSYTTKSHETNSHQSDSNANSNGTKSNGTNSYDTNGHGYHTQGSNSYDSYSNGIRSVSCSHQYHTNVIKGNQTYANEYYTNGGNVIICPNTVNSHLFNSNLLKSNGFTNLIYDPNTATYAAKDFYSEEQAKKRT